MHKKHKIVLGIIVICCGILSYVFKVEYSVIASDGITVVSIVLAIYMTSFSGLVSSDLAKKMQRKEDKIINGKSQLGVLKGYLNAAVGIGIINIVVSCISLILKDKMIEIVNKNTVYYIVSAIGISTLAANLFLMFLLFRFMVNRQLWDK